MAVKQKSDRGSGRSLWRTNGQGCLLIQVVLSAAVVVTGVLALWGGVVLTPWWIILLGAAGWLCAIGSNVTGRFHRKETESALRDQEWLNRLVMENASDIIFRCDLSGHVLFVSPACEVILGYTPEQFMALHWTAVIHPDHQEQVKTAWHTALTKEPSSATYRVQRRDALYIWMETRFQPIVDQSGQVVQVQCSSRDITEREEYKERLAYLAYRDSLTGLYNRAYFNDALRRALIAARQEGKKVAFLILDLDRFKLINDTMGHGAGDQLLVAVGEHLSRSVPPGGVVSRFGGDEFTVLLSGPEAEQEARLLAEQLSASLGKGIELDGQEIWLSTSVGIAVGDGSTPPDHLLRNGDLALYEAKNAGRARYAFFNESMSEASLERLTLEGDLRRAIDGNELRLHYQPIINLLTNQMVSVEALVRWQHPTRGLLAPDAFMPMAEESGLIVPLGHWVFRAACEQLRAWLQSYPEERIPKVSVNLSARQLQNQYLAEEVAEVVEAAGIPAHFLQLEVTETSLIQAPDDATERLNALRDLGIGLAIDGFGRGYSTLNYLQHLPLDRIKIDRSFTSELGDDPRKSTIVQGIVTIARAINLGITIEGVETAEQQLKAIQLGCDAAQGFYFCRPGPAAEIEQRYLPERLDERASTQQSTESG